MSTEKPRRAGAVITSVVAVGLIVGGAYGVTAAMAANPSGPAPVPTSTFEPERLVVDEPIESTPTPTETPAPEPVAEEPAPVVEEPAPAEPAPAPAQPAPAPAPPAPVVEPAPAPAPPPPPVRCPGGSSPTESDGYNDTACMPNTAPNGGSCFEGDNGMLPECQPFRP